MNKTEKNQKVEMSDRYGNYQVWIDSDDMLDSYPATMHVANSFPNWISQYDGSLFGLIDEMTEAGVEVSDNTVIDLGHAEKLPQDFVRMMHKAPEGLRSEYVEVLKQFGIDTDNITIQTLKLFGALNYLLGRQKREKKQVTRSKAEKPAPVLKKRK